MLGDHGRIHQIIMNLGTNAMHAMRETGGILEVKLAPFTIDSDFTQTHNGLVEGEYVRLIFSGYRLRYGSANARAHLRALFHYKRSGRRNRPWIGNGLRNCQGPSRRDQNVYSEPGRGTTVNVYFPVHANLTLATEVRAGAVPMGHGEHVLFVDDEEVLANLGKKRLERWDCIFDWHPRALNETHQRPNGWRGCAPSAGRKSRSRNDYH